MERTVDVEDRIASEPATGTQCMTARLGAASAGMQLDANGRVEACRTKVKLSFKYEGS
jgi:hypothetical protein